MPANAPSASIKIEQGMAKLSRVLLGGIVRTYEDDGGFMAPSYLIDSHLVGRRVACESRQGVRWSPSPGRLERGYQLSTTVFVLPLRKSSRPWETVYLYKNRKEPVGREDHLLPREGIRNEESSFERALPHDRRVGVICELAEKASANRQRCSQTRISTAASSSATLLERGGRSPISPTAFSRSDPRPARIPATQSARGRTDTQ